MPTTSRARRRSTSQRILLVLLLVVLALSCVLGYQAMATARSHRDTAEDALRDYASMATWEFSRVARENLDRFLSRVFEQRLYRQRTREMPTPESVQWGLERALRAFRCDCAELRDPVTHFRIDFADSSIALLPDTMSADFGRRLRKALLAGLSESDREGQGIVVAPAGQVLDAEALLAYTAFEDRYDAIVAVYGFLVQATAFEELFARWFDQRQLLPPAIAGTQPNDSLLYAAVSTPGGSIVFKSAVSYATTFASSDTIGPTYGGLVIEAGVRSDAADHLIIGGVPRSRLPLILILLVLSVATGIAALVQLRREQQLARLREDFISGVSHELRTPLAQIRMFAELLDGDRLRTEEERKRSTGIINREARRLTNLVESILQYSRLGRATVDLNVEKLDVASAVESVIEAFKPIAAARDVKMEAQVEHGLTLRADRDAVSQLLLNLLDNAVKYGPRGQTVTVVAARTGSSACLSVQDEGPGIPKHEQERVWEPYRRLDRETDGTVAGTGIGLAVVDELAALHGGRAWVEDAPAGGARFVVELPGAEIASSAREAAPEPRTVG